MRIISCCLAIVFCGVVFAQSGPTGSSVLAEVNGEAITVADFMFEFGRLSVDAQNRIAQDPNGKMNFLTDIIKKHLLLAEAQKMRLDTLNVVKEAIQRATKDIMVQALLSAHQQNVKVTDEEIKKYYEDNDSIFDVLSRYHLSQIVFADEKSAKDVLKSIKAGTLKWDDAVRNNPGVGNMRSGDAGWIYQDQLVPDARAIVEKLAPGQISDVFKIGNVYYIVKLLESEPPRHLPLEEVRVAIQNFLAQQKGQQAAGEYQNALYMRAKISIDNSILNSLDLTGQRR